VPEINNLTTDEKTPTLGTLLTNQGKRFRGKGGGGVVSSRPDAAISNNKEFLVSLEPFTLEMALRLMLMYIHTYPRWQQDDRIGRILILLGECFAKKFC
jgi:hypothetical protein